MPIDIIKDPITGQQYSRDTSVQGSTYQPYVAPIQGEKAPTGQEYGATGQLQPINSANLSPASLIPYKTPDIPAPYNPSALSAPEQQVQNSIEEIKKLREQIAGKQAFQTQQETIQGVPEIQKTINDLTAEQQTIINEAAQIRLTAPGAGQGALPTAVIDREQAAKLRENAVQALSVSSLLSAAQGNLANAQYLVGRAVTEKFSPLEAQQKAKLDNLDLIIKSPEYTAAEKKRAQDQKDAQDKKSEMIDANKKAYEANLNLANELIKNGFTDTNVLSQIQNAKDSAGNYSVAAGQAIAAQTGALTAKKDTSITELGGRKVLVDNQTGKVIKDLGSAKITSTEPLSVLDIQRYQELYPTAGVIAGDTEAQANNKVAKLNQPKDLTDEEIRKLVNEDKIGNATYEQVIQGIDSEPTLKNKDRAKMIAGEIYGVQTQNPDLEKEITRLKSGGILSDADIRASLRKRGYTDSEINSSSLSGAGSFTESIINYLFK